MNIGTCYTTLYAICNCCNKVLIFRKRLPVAPWGQPLHWSSLGCDHLWGRLDSQLEELKNVVSYPLIFTNRRDACTHHGTDFQYSGRCPTEHSSHGDPLQATKLSHYSSHHYKTPNQTPKKNSAAEHKPSEDLMTTLFKSTMAQENRKQKAVAFHSRHGERGITYCTF